MSGQASPRAVIKEKGGEGITEVRRYRIDTDMNFRKIVDLGLLA